MTIRFQHRERGRGSNAINPRGKGKIAAAILTLSDLQAPREVDQKSLSFRRTGYDA